MHETLKNCPFCGAAAHFEMDEGRWEWVECESCGMQGNRSASLMEDCKPKLADEWNRRAPPAVAGEPDYATFALWYADHIGDENKPVRDAALATYEAFATPQPTQAQAGAVPLTDEQISTEAEAGKYYVEDLLDFNAGVRFAEQYHGIKGGQHGADEAGT